MDQETAHILKESFDRLPSLVQEAILGAEVSQAVQAIGKKRSLLLDQVGDLETEVMLLLVGLADSEEFPDNLEKNLGVDSSLAQDIAADVNEFILEPIKARMIEGTAEEDEAMITRDSLLREIENPSPSVFRTEPVRNAPSLAETHNAKVLGSEKESAPAEPKGEKAAALPPIMDPGHELAAPGASHQPEPAKEPATAPVPPSAAPSKPVPPPAPAAPITEAPRRVTEIKPEMKPPARRSVDPYREPIE
ncbi:MAG TPA: hypothetical protein VD967_01470 [Candidatus Paceibacterota bacterium]|nr:hypothetical protein [Candidatus Paceibacterota bacterium]